MVSRRKRTRGHKRRHVKRTGVTFAKRVKAVVARVEEKKMIWSSSGAFASVGYGGVAPASQPQDVELSNIALGTSSTQRIGRKYRIRSVELRGVLVGGQSALPTDDTYNHFRIIIATWNGDSGATPIHTNSVHPLTPVTRDMSGYPGEWNHNLIHKYLDKHFILKCVGMDAGNGYIPDPRMFHYKKKFKGGLVITTDDANASPDKRLILSMVSDSLLAPSPGFEHLIIIVKFTDE